MVIQETGKNKADEIFTSSRVKHYFQKQTFIPTIWIANTEPVPTLFWLRIFDHFPNKLKRKFDCFRRKDISRMIRKSN